MENLVLDSLEIQRFRVFRHLKIPRLGRVNLITGKNNVGKSCLLEALWLYARRGSPSLIWHLLEARDEGSYPTALTGVGVWLLEERASAIKHLFYGRKDIREYFTDELASIEIGPLNSQADSLSIGVGWGVPPVGKDGQERFRFLEPEEYKTTLKPLVMLFAVQFGEHKWIIPGLGWRDARSSELKEISCVFVPANGLEALQIGQFWDTVTLTDLEEDVLTSLRIIAPEVERVGLVGEPEPKTRRERIPVVRIAEFDDPIPLRSIGEGMTRLFGIALALVNAKDGMLLIDEVDSGLHYSVQPDLWRLIFQVARRLNVQVFATTHSWDCIEGFQKAAVEDEQEEGLLIRLDEIEGEIVPTLFDERRLGVATRRQIEVR